MHHHTEALSMADRILVLRAGQRQQLAAPHTLYHAPANEFVARFIGSAPRNSFSPRNLSGPPTHEVLLSVTCGPHLLKVLVPAPVARPDTPVWLNLSQGPHHFFDPHTGMALVQR